MQWDLICDCHLDVQGPIVANSYNRKGMVLWSFKLRTYAIKYR